MCSSLVGMCLHRHSLVCHDGGDNKKLLSSHSMDYGNEYLKIDGEFWLVILRYLKPLFFASY